MNSVSKEFKVELPKLAANAVLALVFGSIGALSSVTLTGFAEDFGFYSWLVLTLVGGVFLVRALFDVLIVGDKTVGLFMARLGLQQLSSKRRMAKDAIFIIGTILAAAAIYPLLKALGPVGTLFQSATAIVAIGTIFFFVYDITRILHQLSHEKASAVADWLMNEQGGEHK
ncbi:MAG: hypothetical protein JSV51_02020 [Candidatus Bathyarchaeota archaeon]|nr:MAG: hypothetical protein JSV51_02020 [Candidatus Bathyarchaeota archaeon]